MSIKQLSLAWENSQAKGSSLLVLLAMADIAQDSGYCWPGYSYLAKRSRLSRRQAIRIVDNLISIGELIKIQSDRKNSNEYVLFVWGDYIQLRQCTSCLMLEIPELDVFHIHHILPRSEGGTDDPSNLTVLCAACHDEVHGIAGDKMSLGITVGGDTHVTRVVTPMSPDPLRIQQTDDDDDITDTEAFRKCAGLYQQIQLITPLIADRITDALEDYGYMWVKTALERTIENHGTSWRYVAKVLENMKKYGYDWSPDKSKAVRTHIADVTLDPEEFAKYVEENA
jgi:hypothetical protein